jgi:hypothetical protein
MINIEYVCRCGKRSGSLVEQKRHVKFMCPLKHMPPLKCTGTCVTFLGPWIEKEER